MFALLSKLIFSFKSNRIYMSILVRLTPDHFLQNHPQVLFRFVPLPATHSELKLVFILSTVTARPWVPLPLAIGE